jgi:hypothetical protein
VGRENRIFTFSLQPFNSSLFLWAVKPLLEEEGNSLSPIDAQERYLRKTNGQAQVSIFIIHQ